MSSRNQDVHPSVRSPVPDPSISGITDSQSPIITESLPISQSLSNLRGPSPTPPHLVRDFLDAVASTRHSTINTGVNAFSGPQVVICVGTNPCVDFTVPEKLVRTSSNLLSAVLAIPADYNFPIHISCSGTTGSQVITLPDVDPALSVILAYWIFESKLPEAEVVSGDVEVKLRRLTGALALAEELQVTGATADIEVALTM